MTTSIFSKNSTQSSIQVNGVDSVVLDATGIVSGVDTGIRQITGTVGSSALTVTLLPCVIQFRSNTLTSGTVNQRGVTSTLSLVIPSSATLGTISGVASRLILIAIDNAGTVELAITNLAGGINLNETNLISTTAISATSTSASVIYSNTARTNVPYRVVGYIDSTQTTAGVWSVAPTVAQGAGGQAMDSMSSLGYGQTYTSPSRVLGTTYYNTSNKPRMVTLSAITSAATLFSTYVTVAGVSLPSDITHSNSSGFAKVTNFIVPPGMSYIVTMSNATLQSWVELG